MAIFGDKKAKQSDARAQRIKARGAEIASMSAEEAFHRALHYYDYAQQTDRGPDGTFRYGEAQWWLAIAVAKGYKL